MPVNLHMGGSSLRMVPHDWFCFKGESKRKTTNFGGFPQNGTTVVLLVSLNNKAKKRVWPATQETHLEIYRKKGSTEQKTPQEDTGRQQAKTAKRG